MISTAFWGGFTATRSFLGSDPNRVGGATGNCPVSRVPTPHVLTSSPPPLVFSTLPRAATAAAIEFSTSFTIV